MAVTSEGPLESHFDSGKNDSSLTDSVHRAGPSPEGGSICNVWPAGGHLGWAEEQPNSLVHLGGRQLQLRQLQPCGGKRPCLRHDQTSLVMWQNTLTTTVFLYSNAEVFKSANQLINFVFLQTELLASCASDRSIVLYDMRESTPLKKVGPTILLLQDLTFLSPVCTMIWCDLYPQFALRLLWPWGATHYAGTLWKLITLLAQMRTTSELRSFGECCGGSESCESTCALNEVLHAWELEGFCSIGRPSEHIED